MTVNLTGMGGMALALYILLFFMAVSLICAVLMVVSLAKGGDERRKFILSKACTAAFIIYCVKLIIDVLCVLLIKNSLFAVEYSPIFSLGILSIVFTVCLFVYKRKYGD